MPRPTHKTKNDPQTLVWRSFCLVQNELQQIAFGVVSCGKCHDCLQCFLTWFQARRPVGYKRGRFCHRQKNVLMTYWFNNLICVGKRHATSFSNFAVGCDSRKSSSWSTVIFFQMNNAFFCGLLYAVCRNSYQQRRTICWWSANKTVPLPNDAEICKNPAVR